ncbi:hypothetical protein KCQ_05461 [Pectobacterium atrosepticum ICMP 1526]|uniref:hypothetical protein n=1 Tax=Pectobacterium atrosepticum TaxID=29471 RepID=UPI0005025628|nr:hypothetical protein [Pectobacterium atrosepticum]KFX10730.1 hypothetical protein JV34_22705 [Pectobacterium atrosepticum]KMK87231.1 hypothetical protein KCQ_05461 [Pectobacterium atrosepticum ICMP 1526]
MKKIIGFIAISLILSGCDSKQEKIDFYLKKENQGEFIKSLSMCRSGSSAAKDCEAIDAVYEIKKREKTNDKSSQLKKEFSFDH